MKALEKAKLALRRAIKNNPDKIKKDLVDLRDKQKIGSNYYESPEQVLFISPVTRFLTRIFGKKWFVKRCKVCKKIPSTIWDGKYCEKHKEK